MSNSDHAYISRSEPLATPVSLWQRDLASIDEVGTYDIARFKFLAAAKGEAFPAARNYMTAVPLLSVADAIVQLINGTITGAYAGVLMIEGRLTGQPALVTLKRNRRDSDDEEVGEGIGLAEVLVIGHRVTHQAIFAMLDQRYGKERYTAVKWWYQDDGRADSKTTYLPPLKTQLLPEFYPDLPDSPQAFLADYLASEGSILMMAGPPGTGKTSMLRHLICDHKLAAHVMYDESLMRNDSVFQSFLFEKDSDILIIEDADTILASRESEHNKLMARFLNISDGLIKLPNKKLVFTTNLTDFGKVDPALLRPGRCYGVLHTRHLNLTEAQAAARAAKLPFPTEKREYTLAELFNQGQRQHTIRRVGFSAA